MPTLRLTDAAVQRIKTPEDAPRAEYWDLVTPGLGLRVSATGARSWVMILRTLKAGAWKQQRVTLGRYPAVSLGEARQLAVEAKTRAEQGGDPAGIRKERRAELERDSRNTFAAVVADFLSKYRGRQKRRPAPRTQAEIKRVLESDLFSAWRDRPLAEVARRDVLDALDVLVDREAEVMANRTLAYLGMFFGWAVDRGIIQADPTDRIRKPGAEQSRERVLTLDEMHAIWGATAPTQVSKGDLFACIVKVLMLTGQRRTEVAGMHWAEVDLTAGLWTLPGDRTKNHREHLVPLASPVLDILRERQAEQVAMGMTTSYVFTSFGPHPFSGWSKSKARLDARAGIAPWTLHDLRRTLATRMAEDLRIPPHIIEATINHVSGTRAGVAGTYNRASYLDERRAALDAWAGYVLRIVGEVEADNVVTLRHG